jgi:hypothetical protein
MKKLLGLIAFIFGLQTSFAQKLSPEAEISVITCGPWQGELWSAFGHSAFRVYDPVNGIDDAYNYGVFDFDQPNFYLNFARGYSYYKLGVIDFPRFQYYYEYYNRYVHAQVLNLTQTQKQRLFEFLLWNAQPENQSYRYDYFYDNCATRIRDVVAKVFGDSVTFDGSYIETDYTIRELTDLYLAHQPWGDLGIDVCLGLPMDKTATPYEYMFLPDYIESGFDHATIKQDSGVVKLVKNKLHIYQPREEESTNGLPHPLVILSILTALSIIISIWDVRRRRLSIWFDVILFGGVGMIGLLLLLLWTATDHQAAAKNFNLLWALPTHVIAVVAFIKNPAWLKYYFLATVILLALLILTWNVLPQQLNYSLVPVIAALLVRASIQYRLRSGSFR